MTSGGVSYVPTTEAGFGQLQADAWGVPKVSIPHSAFHGLFTFDIPSSQWFMYHDTTQTYTSTVITSVDGAAKVQATAAIPAATLESRYTPRYQPNRGVLYSTALWCPNKEASGVRQWGLSTGLNGVYFELAADGKLYACLKSLGVVTKRAEIDTSVVSGFDVQKGNVYDIQYQWRGVGNYVFYINLVRVHVFANLGTLTALSISDPAMPAFFSAARIAGDVEMLIGCVDISSENGNDDRLQYASSYAEKTVNGTDVPVICILNPSTINSKTNTRMLELSRISFNCDKKSIFKVWVTRDPTAITGATFVTRGNGSFTQTDSPDSIAGAVSATAVTPAKLVLVTAVPLAANGFLALNNPFQNRIDFAMVRGDYLVVTNTVATGLSSVVIEWGEAV